MPKKERGKASKTLDPPSLPAELQTALDALYINREAEFCRVAEARPRVKAYVKNQGLGLEVPYLFGSTQRKYLLDFNVQIDDDQTKNREPDLLNLVVEIKGYRNEDAKEKANTMHNYWVPGVNNLGSYERWAFAEFTAVYENDVFVTETV